MGSSSTNKAPHSGASPTETVPQQGREVPHDRQTKAGAGVATRRLALELLESIEDGLSLVRRDPRAAVADLELNALTGLAQRRADTAASRREFEGIRQQVQHDAVQLGRVRVDKEPGPHVNDKRDALLVRQRREVAGDLAHERRRVGPGVVRRAATGLDLRHVQQIVDVAEHGARVPLDDLEIPPQAGIHARSLTEMLLDRSENQRQWRPQLVADVGEESSLGLTDLGEVFIPPGELVDGAGQPLSRSCDCLRRPVPPVLPVPALHGDWGGRRCRAGWSRVMTSAAETAMFPGVCALATVTSIVKA